MKFAPTKDSLRREIRAKLAELSEADVRAKSATIWERLSVLPSFTTAERLLIYVSKHPEVETHGLIQQLLAMGRSVCVPSFNGSGYGPAEIRDFDAEMAAARFGILEPRPETIRPIAAEKIAAALVPGLAFDETGNRLGRGMGFFDHILRNVSGAKIALAYDFQIVNEVPIEPHDVRMDFIVTEMRVLKAEGDRNE